MVDRGVPTALLHLALWECKLLALVFNVRFVQEGHNIGHVLTEHILFDKVRQPHIVLYLRNVDVGIEKTSGAIR
jgi:tRNA A37 threonylcarbamoyltransferase TsaD